MFVPAASRSLNDRQPGYVAGYAYAIYDAGCTTPRIPPPSAERPRNVGVAIQQGTQQYTAIKSSTLLIYAAPKEGEEPNDAARAREGCATAFEKLVPTARVVRLPGATHFVFISNEADVLREVRSFAGGLKR